MKTRAVAAVGVGGVLVENSSRPPLTIRQLRTAETDVCALCLVGSAAGPLAGDDVELRLSVADHARATVTASGASIAQGRGSTVPGRLRSVVTVGEHAQLDAEPAALIAAAGSRTEVTVELRLAGTATVRWRELLVLGRFDEPAGALTLRWSVYRAGSPLLMQTVTLDGSGWPGLLAGARVLAGALLTGVPARTVVADPTAVCQQLSDDAVLITVLDTDAASAQARLQTLLMMFEPMSAVGR